MCVCGLRVEYMWHWSFFGCRWYWTCRGFYHRIWSELCRRVFIVLFIWCGFARLHLCPPPHQLHLQMIVYVNLYMFVLFGCRFSHFDFLAPIFEFYRGGGGLGKAVCSYLGWIEANILVCSLAYCCSPLGLAPSHTTLFPYFQWNIDQLLQGCTFPATSFFERHFLCRLFQNVSYIGDYLCDCIYCYHEGNFGLLWKK